LAKTRKVPNRSSGVDPLDYIRDVLMRLLRMTTRDDLTPMLPAAWKPLAS